MCFMLLDVVARVAGRPLRRMAEPRRADAIVVLGVPARATGELTSVGEERVRAAAELWHRGLAPVVCITGGAVRGPVEAVVMAERARALGVPDAALRLDMEAQSTYENAVRVAEMLPAGARVWLVTQPFHLRRSMHLFRQAGLQPLPWHIEDSMQYDEPARALRWIAREYASWGRVALRDVRAAIRRTSPRNR
jgi:uncharacterized SAM-binding protein YcdF (DUF218 family)